MLPITDGAMRAIEYALGGLELRSDVRANNISNVNTPGFAGMTVDFESALSGAMAQQAAGGPGPRPDAPLPAPERGMALPNGQGNTVDLEGEMTGMIKDNLTRSTLVNHYNTKIRALRSVITGR